MANLVWSNTAQETYDRIKREAEQAQVRRVRANKTATTGKKKNKASKQEGLFKQVHKTALLLAANPRHSGLSTHKYDSIENPYDKSKPVFEAYVQNNTPGAYRMFWCYGPGKDDVTIIAITPHP